MRRVLRRVKNFFSMRQYAQIDSMPGGPEGNLERHLRQRARRVIEATKYRRRYLLPTRIVITERRFKQGFITTLK